VSLRWSEDFPPDLDSLQEARAFVSDKLAGAGVDMDVAVLLTSELVTNAVAHAHTRYSVVVDSEPGAARVEVWDGDHHSPKVSTPAAYAERGRGMMLVTVLASAWGVDQVRDGKRVWFELPAHAESSAEPAVTRSSGESGRPAA
jgi:anti-sigma regulatory factor (Ser/Thr protein kinase)